MKNRKKAISILMVVVLLLIAPFSMVIVGLSPGVFNQTYFAELVDMYDNLYNIKNKKIVFIGTSSVAFGIDSNLLEKELGNASIDYSVCNFGLYGALGTKIMLDLSIDAISKDDIVILTPEINAQTLSLYFSGENSWYAIENNVEMLSKIKSDNKSQMIGAYGTYVSKKMSYIQDKSLQSVSGIYSHSSFDKDCVLRGDREENIMLGGYDSNNMISFDSKLYSTDFIDYVNEYNKKIRNKGATMLYCFGPMNQKGIEDESKLDSLYDYLYQQLGFEMIGNPHQAIYESGWFYDSNCHMNSSGMIVNTLRYVKDIKNYFSNDVANITSIPQMPEESDTVEIENGDNTYASCFTYTLLENGSYSISGLTEEGKSYKELTIPTMYDGIVVREIEKDVFKDNQVIEKIIVPSSIQRIRDYSFTNTPNLKTINLLHTKPSKISVGYYLLDGTSATIIVSKESYSLFASDYTWSYYSKRIAYEK